MLMLVKRHLFLSVAVVAALAVFLFAPPVDPMLGALMTAAVLALAVVGLLGRR